MPEAMDLNHFDKNRCYTLSYCVKLIKKKVLLQVNAMAVKSAQIGANREW